MAAVLLVDDEATLRLLIGRQLQRAGHAVTTAEDGLEAVTHLERTDFDVVVSDMKMPRLDGMGLLARAMELAPDTEFIILTGHGNMENAVTAFKTGNVFDYLLKPLEDIHELDAVVARAVERRHLRRENRRLIGELEGHIQDLEEAKQKLSDLAEQDGLTGLLNHRTVHARLHALMESDPDALVTVVIMDLDGFKRINDTYGHLIGDQALRYLAQCLREVCSDTVLLGRCGGDEFMAIVPDQNVKVASALTENAPLWMAAHPFINPEGVALPLQLCYGLADSRSANGSPISLVAAADAALYAGKQQGGGTVVLHMAAENDDSSKQEDRTPFSVLDSLITAIDNKDHYTRIHSEDVTRFSLELVQALGCSEEIYQAMRVAGLLHDVGKIGVPDAILRKPGKLTPDEYEVMKNHVTLSALIIHGLPHLADILDAVANHHERWDGKGYPQGLAGEQIPFLGRIMAIADAFSAMTTDRPYRAGMPLERAVEEIERGIGTQFDPELAPVFIETVRAHPERFIREHRKAA